MTTDERFDQWITAKLTELRDAGLILGWHDHDEHGKWIETPETEPSQEQLRAARRKLSPSAWKIYLDLMKQPGFRRERGDPPPHGPQSPQ